MLVLIPIYAPLQAQWTKTNGTAGGMATVLLNNGSTTYAGVNGGGVYRTNNVFGTWTQASAGLKGNSLNPTSILASGTTLWLGTQDGLFRSGDDGATWTASGAATFSGVKITKVATDGMDIFVATEVRNLSTIDTVETPSECLYRSSDNGATWTAISSALPKHVGESFSVVVVRTTFDTRLYALSNRAGVQVSTDAGKTWNSFNQGLTGYAFRLEVLDMLPDGGTLYLCNRDGVYSRRIALTPTQPESAAWQAVNSGGLKGQTVNAITKTGDALFVGTEASGAYRSMDGGTTWTPVSAGLTNLAVLSLASAGTTLLLGTEGAGIFTSPRTDVAWEQASAGIVSGQVLSLSVLNNTVFAATYGNGIQFSRDGGTTWSAAKGINNPPQGAQGLSAYVSKIAASGNRLFAATFGGLFASSDGGATWATANGTGTGALKDFALSVYDIALNPATNKLTAATGDGVFISSDDGRAWVRRTNGLDDSVAVHLLAFNGATMLGGTFESGIYRSTDGGETWREASKGLSIAALTVYDILVSGANVFAATEDGIYQSSDDGRTWTRSSTGLDANNHAMYRLAQQGTTLIATGAAGVYRSTNGGAAWQAVSQGLTNTSNHALAADNTNIYLADYAIGTGVWKRPLSQITSVSSQNEQVAASINMRLAPNPANAEFVVHFVMPQIGRAVITVSDVLGRTLRREELTALQAGAHTLRLGADDINAGTYIVQISIGGASVSRLLHIIR
jgi:photosystem II stability/assembly factor-like uncharacterized protein